MHWRLWISFAFVLLIVVGGISTLRHNTALCEDLIGELDLQLAEPTPEGVRALRRHWEDLGSYFSCLIPHDRIDNLTSTLCAAEGFAEIGSGDELRGALREARLMLQLIQHFDMPTLQNIL